ncbi:MAG: 4-alpha-glucanotransferase, partial [Verrucomicrobia bacterium]|nr:4-alpha-glucanotransferase [Verrucomicrobiota bacterium]
WCKEVGFDVIQLLPLNDSGHDTSPYSAHSAMALHPIYVSLPYKQDDSQRVQYHQVLKDKELLLRRHFKENRSSANPAFMKQEWLDGYARYKVLKDLNNQLPWWEWKNIPKTLPEEELEYHKFVQYLCYEQFGEVKKAADEAGIMLKGDIPILINRDSADVWQHPELFDLSYSAGAPPDYYAQEGQNWGFPIYRWDVLEKRGYSWWKERLQLAEKLYHIYRLDHIVGFFRIWAIPEGKKATEGFFIPENRDEWIPQGEKILRMMIESCSMQAIGEDLGDIPPDVRTCMSRLGIPGTKVMRWEKNWHTDQSFIKPDQYPPLSMTTVSTHDSEPLEMWWDNAPAEAEAFCKAIDIPYTPLLTPKTRRAVLKASHTSASSYHINLLQEYLDVFTELTWPDPEDDRINIPGLVLDRNWTYRFRPTLQEIISHPGLKELMLQLTSSPK